MTETPPDGCFFVGGRGKDGKAKGYLAFGQFVWGVDEKPMLGWII